MDQTHAGTRSCSCLLGELGFSFFVRLFACLFFGGWRGVSFPLGGGGFVLNDLSVGLSDL